MTELIKNFDKERTIPLFQLYQNYKNIESQSIIRLLTKNHKNV